MNCRLAFYKMRFQTKNLYMMVEGTYVGIKFFYSFRCILQVLICHKNGGHGMRTQGCGVDKASCKINEVVFQHFASQNNSASWAGNNDFDPGQTIDWAALSNLPSLYYFGVDRLDLAGPVDWAVVSGWSLRYFYVNDNALTGEVNWSAISGKDYRPWFDRYIYGTEVPPKNW